MVKNALSIGIPSCRLARFVWNVGTGVIKRAAVELSRMGAWIDLTYREFSDGGIVTGFNAKVKFLTRHLGYNDLTEQYGYHRYPHRLACAK